ncbi:hypothetical protein ASE95_04575 [Sphingomonas sp. Leaf231]|nr:hypothetical protein ASE95_04575 [Sphingomonas sp. Leaf231]
MARVGNGPRSDQAAVDRVDLPAMMVGAAASVVDNSRAVGVARFVVASAAMPSMATRATPGEWPGVRDDALLP